MPDIYIDPGAVVTRPPMSPGSTLFVGQGAKVIEPTCDGAGAAYGIRSHGHHVTPRTPAEYNHLRTQIIRPKLSNYTNKAILGETMDVLDPVITDCGNDPFMSMGGWNVVRGSGDWKPGQWHLSRMGKRKGAGGDPEGHSDGGQPLHSMFWFLNLWIDMRDADGAGEMFEEAGAGIFVKPDFGAIHTGRIEKCKIATTHGYAVRVTHNEGEYPSGIKLIENDFFREDGKHPIDVDAGTVLIDNRDHVGRIVRRKDRVNAGLRPRVTPSAWGARSDG